MYTTLYLSQTIAVVARHAENLREKLFAKHSLNLKLFACLDALTYEILYVNVHVYNYMH